MVDITGMEPSGRVIPLYKGDYNNIIPYEIYDVVLYNNSSYIARQNTIGNPPPEPDESRNDYWQLVAKGIIEADISSATVKFTQATQRVNIESGESGSTLFGKIKKWLADLKPIAFSGNVADVTGAVAASQIMTTEEQIDANTNASNVAGAVAVKSLKSDLANSINQINSNLAGKLTNGGYYVPSTSINSITTPGMSRLYVQEVVDDVNYLDYTGRIFLICSGHCAGFIYQIIFGDNGYCAYRHNVTQGEFVFDYNTPIYRLDSKTEIAQLNGKMLKTEVKTADVTVPSKTTSVFNIGGFTNIGNTIACIVNVNMDFVQSSGRMENAKMRVSIHNDYQNEQNIQVNAIRLYV